VCPAHGTAFDMETGEVVGKWCPSLPEALSTGFGLTPKKPLSVLQARVNEAGEIEVNL
jgi:nitrite reductase/ring-hydroxylating ferredoxin subunit